MRLVTLAVAAALALPLAACDDLVVVDREIDVDATGTVLGSAFRDMNGTGSLEAADSAAEGLRVRLRPASGGTPVAAATTDSLGLFELEDVPVGTYRLSLDPSTVGDTLDVHSLDGSAFTLAASDTATFSFYVSYPTFTLREAREGPAGRKGFVHGIVLNPRYTFGDGMIHLQENDTYLRALGVPRAELLPGDSVRVLATTGTDAGQPVLTEVTPFLLGDRVVIPRPTDVSTRAAATADAGELDAALVRVRDADVLDTDTEIEDLVVTVDDGTGEVEVVLRDFIDFNRSAIVPDSTILREARGVLVPRRSLEGDVRWRIVPRFPADLLVEEIPEEGEGE